MSDLNTKYIFRLASFLFFLILLITAKEKFTVFVAFLVFNTPTIYQFIDVVLKKYNTFQFKAIYNLIAFLCIFAVLFIHESFVSGFLPMIAVCLTTAVALRLDN